MSDVIVKESLTDEAAIEMLNSCKERNMSAKYCPDGKSITIDVDDTLVARIESRGSNYFVSVMPDIFSFANWSGVIDTRSVKFDIGVVDHLTVSFKTLPVTLADIVQSMYSALVELNLYGYIIED